MLECWSVGVLKRTLLHYSTTPLLHYSITPTLHSSLFVAKNIMNLITLKTFEPEQIVSIIDTSIQIKQNPLEYGDVLKHKKMYMLFEKTSTRTSLGFGMGFNELGGTHFIQRWQDSNFAIGEIVDEAREAIEGGGVAALGPLMDENHAILAKIGVSSPLLDDLVESARTAGAVGAKLSGAGRGGNMIALVEDDQADEVTKALKRAGTAQVIRATVRAAIR